VHPQPLIHAVVQETMILVAHLATAGGVRAPLAGIANQVFADLTAQLATQGVTKTVIADMFGMALSTYHRRVRAAAESQTEAGRSVWEAILEFVRANEPAAASLILKRFARDDATVLASVLRDLTDSGIVYRMGRGAQAVYRMASPGDFAGESDERRKATVRSIVWLAIVRRGPVGLAALSALTGESIGRCREHADALVAEQLIERRELESGSVYESSRLEVPIGQAEGWEAAVLDHFQAVVTAICVKLRLGASRSAATDAVGGSTYTLDVWRGHPFEQEALDTLARVRRGVKELRERIDKYNELHERPNDRDREVVVYVGQYLKTDDDLLDEDEAND
jgi:hypothetical protein